MKTRNGPNMDFEEEFKHEILKNTISIVEQLKAKKIPCIFTDTDESGSKLHSGKFLIKIGLKKDRVLPKTKLERELAKIVFDSPYDYFIKKIKDIRTNTTVEQRQSFIKNIYTIFENLESRRTESCYGQIYRGADERFIEARQHDARKKISNRNVPTDPIEALKLARYDQNGPVKKSEFEVAIDYMSAVEKTGKMGAVELALMYWQKVVQPFLEKNLQKPDLSEDGNSSGEKNPSPITRDDKRKAKIRNEIECIENELPNVSDVRPRLILDAKLRELKAELLKDHYTGQLLLDFSEPIKIWSEQKGSLEQKSNELKQQGSEEIQKIKEQLVDLSKKQTPPKFKWSTIKNEIFEVRPQSNRPVAFNKNTSIRLKNAFKNIQGGRISEIDSTGEQIDVDSYIDYKINRTGNFYQSSRDFVGFDIVIAIDESGSMSNEVAKVKRMCCTLYDAVSGLPNVRLTVVGWAGSSIGRCVVKKITKASQIDSLGAYGTTPMGSAVWYCKSIIENQSSPKRLFVLITDGEPNTENDAHAAKDGVRNLRNKGVICNGICVGNCSDKQIITMNNIFAGNVAVCDNFTEVDEFLRSKISSQIIQSLRAARLT